MITSTSNQQVKNLLQLQKKSKARKEQGVFVVEGVKMFREAPADWIVKTYVSQEFLKKEEASVLKGREYENRGGPGFQDHVRHDDPPGNPGGCAPAGE